MNELKTWQFSDSLPEDAEVFARWGKTPDVPAWNHEQYLRDVIRCLQEGKRGLVEGLEGRKSLELINALYESAETGNEIPLRFAPQKSRLGRTA